MLIYMIMVVTYELLEGGSYTCFMRFLSKEHGKYVLK